MRSSGLPTLGRLDHQCRRVLYKDYSTRSRVADSTFRETGRRTPLEERPTVPILEDPRTRLTDRTGDVGGARGPLDPRRQDAGRTDFLSFPLRTVRCTRFASYGTLPICLISGHDRHHIGTFFLTLCFSPVCFSSGGISLWFPLVCSRTLCFARAAAEGRRGMIAGGCLVRVTACRRTRTLRVVVLGPHRTHRAIFRPLLLSLLPPRQSPATLRRTFIEHPLPTTTIYHRITYTRIN